MIGIGDDAALARPTPGRDLILTSDWTIENVHFRLKLHPPESVGHRALARALSDIAAMGGRPRWALVSLAIPRRLPLSWTQRLYSGMSRLARTAGVLIAGGDTSVVAKRIAVDIVLIGDAPRGRALHRSGARPGDQIYVSGQLGLSALGLKLLETGRRNFKRAWREALSAHLRPNPQLALGEVLARRRLATAMMDISDGLSMDLPRLCHASAVGARVWESLLPMPTTKEVGRLNSLQLALHGGEDYQLLFTVSPHVAAKLPPELCGVRLSRIGVIDPGNALRLIRTSGRVQPFRPAGFDHFRK